MMLYIVFITCCLTAYLRNVIGEIATINNDDCDFATAYDLHNLFESIDMQEEFLMKVTWWEGKFFTNDIAINTDNGLIHLAAEMDFETGLTTQPIAELDAHIEGLHLALLALALDGNKYVVNFIKSSIEGVWPGNLIDYVLDQLQRKITSYEGYRKQYPGFGGYLVRSTVNNGTDIIPAGNSLDAYELGNFVWGLAAIIECLQQRHSELEKRYSDYLSTLTANVMTIFYKDYGNESGFLAKISIKDIKAAPSTDNYVPWPGWYCSFENPCFINDALWEENVWIFFYLYGNWSRTVGDAAKQQTLARKINAPQAANFSAPSGEITVLNGKDNYIEEKLGLLFLPHFDIDIAQRAFLNGERARAQYSNMQNIPGLSFDPTLPSEVSHSDTTIGPIIAAPMLAHPKARAYGTVWLATMLQGSKMQGPLGHTRQAYFNGTIVMEWLDFNKLYLVLGISGGISNITRRFLQRTNKYPEFFEIIESEYNATFAGGLCGENIDFMLPKSELPKTGAFFTQCKGKKKLFSAESSSSKTVIVIVASMTGFVLAAAILVYCCVLRKRKQRRHLLQLLSLKQDEQIIITQEDLKMQLLRNVAIKYDEKLGQGSSANVVTGILRGHRQRATFKKHNAGGDLKVAVKLLKLDKHSETDTILRELKTLSQIGHHDNIISFFGIVCEGSSVGIVMELADRNLLCELKMMRSRGLLSQRFAASVGKQITSAMVYLSSLGFVHRDVAARNVLMQNQTAKQQRASVYCEHKFHVTASMDGNRVYHRGHIFGEKRRVSHEEAENDFRWAFGVLLYEIYTMGAEPYEGIAVIDLKNLLQRGDRLPKPDFACDAIYSLMKRCWQAKPSDRPTFFEIHGILDDFEAVIAHERYDYAVVAAALRE